MKYLLHLGADVNFHGNWATPLHAAAVDCKSSLDILRILLNFEVNVNLRMVDGNTLLAYALWYDAPEFAIELIKNGACVEAIAQDDSSIFDIT